MNKENIKKIQKKKLSKLNNVFFLEKKKIKKEKININH